MYEVELPVFRGPLDLLLHLIEREELDITTVSLVQVTDQYLAVIRSGGLIDMAALSDFIVIGARLIYLKSRALLPRPVQAEPEAEEADGDELVRLLEEYRRFKGVAEQLQERQVNGVRAYRRASPPPVQMTLPLGLEDVTLERLIEVFREALDREPEVEPVAVIERDPVTIRSKIGEIMAALRVRGRVGFRAIIEGCRRRVEVVVAFLAVLELIKDGKLVAVQDSPYGEIELAVPAAA